MTYLLLMMVPPHMKLPAWNRTWYGNLYLGLTSLPATILGEDGALAQSQVLIALLRIRVGLIVGGSSVTFPLGAACTPKQNSNTTHTVIGIMLLRVLVLTVRHSNMQTRHVQKTPLVEVNQAIL